MIINNCEHFENKCTLGSHRSKQVENVLTGEESPIKKGFDMVGLVRTGISALSSMVEGLFGGGKDNEKRIVTTTYEPDKVRVAEIEAQVKGMIEKVRFEDNRSKEKAQKELVTHMIEQEKILMQVKIEGFEYLSESINKLGQNMAELLILQRKELDTNQNESEKEINLYYSDFVKKLQKSSFDFKLNDIPKLFAQLKVYEKGSVEHDIYSDLIKETKKSHVDNMNNELAFFLEQKKKRFDNNSESRKQLELDLSSMSNKILETVNKQSKLLGLNKNEKALLEEPKQEMIEEENVEEKAAPKLVNDINNQEEDFIDV